MVFSLEGNDSALCTCPARFSQVLLGVHQHHRVRECIWPSQRRRKCKSTINVRVRFTRMTLPVSVAASSNEVIEAKPSPITQTVVPSWKNPAGSFFYSHARVMVCLRTSRSYALSWLFVIAEATASKFPKCLSWLNPRLYLDCSNACTHLRSPV